MEEHAHLKYEKEGHVLILALNRSAKSNAINKQLLADLSESLQRGANDEQVRVVVLRAEGKHFSVGADIDEIKELMSVADYESFFRCFHDTLSRLENMPKPTIAAINGCALGGGCELSLAADIRIAAEDATFALLEIKSVSLLAATDDQREGFRAFLEKQEPKFVGR